MNHSFNIERSLINLWYIGCHQLKVIIFANCYNAVTDASVLYLANGTIIYLRYYQYLIISFVEQVVMIFVILISKIVWYPILRLLILRSNGFVVAVLILC
jgi:hypothetical protein